MPVAVRFGAFDFEQSVELYRPRQRPRVKPVIVPRRDGVRAEVAPMGQLEIQLAGRWIAATPEGLRAKFDAMKTALFKRREALTLFDDRFIECQLQAYADDFVPGAGMLVARYDLSFLADLPFLQSVTLNAQEQTVAASPAAINVTTGGTAPTRPVIQVRNTSGGSIINDIKIETLTFGQALVYTGTLNDGGVLSIDMQERSIKHNTAEDLSFEGSFWELRAGLNQLRYTGGVPVTVTVEWRDHWF